MEEQLGLFQDVLVRTLQPEAAIRTEAETELVNLVVLQPDMACTMFLLVMKGSESVEARQASAVLFRRYSTHYQQEIAFWARCQEATQAAALDEIMLALQAQESRMMRNQVIEAIVHIANIYAKKQQDAIGADPSNQALIHAHFWPGLLQGLWSFATTEDAGHRECAFRIIAEMPGVFGTLLKRYLAEVRQLLETYMQTPPADVQFEAAKAFCALLTRGEIIQKNSLIGLVPLALRLITSFLEANLTSQANELLQQIVGLAELAPHLFRPHIQAYITTMVQICGEAQLEKDCRALAMECLTVLGESGPHMVIRSGIYVDNVIPLMFQFMTEVEEEEGWSQQDALESMEEFDTIAVTGEQALDRVSIALGGKVVLPTAIEILKKLFACEEWQAKQSAILGLSVLAEGCYSQLKGRIGEILPIVAGMYRHEHPRVRFAVCQCLGQLATDFKPKNHTETAIGFQSVFHELVVPTLCAVIDENAEHPRVQVHAAAALVNFFDHASKKILQPYLDTILQGLARMLQSQFLICKEQSATTITSVAHVAKDHFKTYYQVFVPPLVDIIKTIDDKKYLPLRGKVIEALSFIGMAVGKEMFQADAHEFMALLVKAHQMSPEDDVTGQYTLAAFGRICQVLGKDFGQYLQYVLPFILDALNAPLDLQDTDLNGSTLEGNPDNWQLLQIESTLVGIKTTILADKRSALELLCIFSRVLEGDFAGCLDPVVPHAMDMLTFQYDETVRAAAAICAPCLLLCMVDSPAISEGFVKQFFEQAMVKYAEQLGREGEAQTIQFQFRGLQECIIVLKSANMLKLLSHEVMLVFTTILTGHLEEYHERSLMRDEENQANEDYDPATGVANPAVEEGESDILAEIASLFHELFDATGELFVPYFESLSKFLPDLLKFDRPAYDRQWGLCIYDDLIEAAGEAALPFFSQYAARMLECLQDEAPEVRQAAAYGVGVMGMSKCPEYNEACSAALPLLAQAINNPSAREIGNVDPTENAISAFVKIIDNPKMGLNLGEYLPVVAAWLPVEADPEEAEHTYGFFIKHLAAGNQLFQDEALFSKVVGALCGVLFSELFEDDFQTQAVVTLASLPSFGQWAAAHTNKEFIAQFESHVQGIQQRVGPA